MYDRIYKYKRLTLYFGISLLISFGSSARASQISIFIKSLDSRQPVQGAVIDLHACNLGKFFSDENGKVQIQSDKLQSCVMYISASGYISLVRNLSVSDSPTGERLTFYMQRQDRYKSGRIWSSEDYSPIANVEVIIREKNDPDQYSVHTDEYGQFSLVHNSTKPVQLEFKHPDFQNLEKIFYFRKEMGGLGSFFMHPKEVVKTMKEIEAPKLKGYASKKFTFRKPSKTPPPEPDDQYIIVLSLLKNTDNIDMKFPGLDVKTENIGSWTRIYLGPFTSEQNARVKLGEIDRTYPNAKVKPL